MISYKPLQKLLIDREIKKSKIAKDLKLSSATMAKLNTNKYISLEVIDKLCGYLQVDVEDIIQYEQKKEDN